MIYFWVEMIVKTEYHWRGKKTAHQRIARAGCHMWERCQCCLCWVALCSLHSRGPCHREFRRPQQCLRWQYDWWADTRADGPFTRHPRLAHTEGEREFLTHTYTHTCCPHCWASSSMKQCLNQSVFRTAVAKDIHLLDISTAENQTHTLQYNYSSTSSLLIKVTIPVTIFYSH